MDWFLPAEIVAIDHMSEQAFRPQNRSVSQASSSIEPFPWRTIRPAITAYTSADRTHLDRKAHQCAGGSHSANVYHVVGGNPMGAGREGAI
jgi:hypothetical protein